MLSEFTRSNTAARHHFDNTPSPTAIGNLKALCGHVLEPLRNFAQQPILISSGYRSQAVNSAVGGKANSQHLTGEACDIHIPDKATGQRWIEWMENWLEFDQLAKEKAHPDSPTFWIHVSFSKTRNRQQVLYLTKHPK